ncbi:MAG TPA: hypothetical protein VMF69_28495 [Gemmataceae bacterium]|nr:hypothetical protein [Gemmataceae bacterium]
MTAHPRSHRFALVFTGVLAAAICGCGGGTGTVEGKVTVDGKPAVGATVIFSGGENRSEMAVVRDDGTYQAPRVPVGPVKVALMPAMMLGMGRGPLAAKGGKSDMEKVPKSAQPSSPPPAIPKRYTDVRTSDLTLTVKGGRNEFNIEMSSP